MKDTILTKIIKDKYEWITKLKKLYPLKSFNHKVNPSTRSFYHAISDNNKIEFILECKKASPSKGIICSDFDPINIASIYRHYASVISVLTEEKYFKGNLNFLRQVSQSINQPILCKDFIIDPWQIYLARLYQADAILLMLSILNDDNYCKLVTVAHHLNMGILTEVINNKERNRAISLKAKVIGINNRDLRYLSINLNRINVLSPKLPADINIISESGITICNKVRKISNYTNGFLIGSTLMAETNLITSLFKILLGANKVCGLTRTIDARASIESGAIYGGLIFIPGTPRVINENIAQNIISSAALHYVGVFSNNSIKKIVNITTKLAISILQLHGNENQNYIDILNQYLVSDGYLWKVFDIFNIILPINNLSKIDRYVLDNGGGSGKSFNWLLLNEIKLDNIMLAGGLTTANCIAATRLGCAGIDFNSKLEIEPGIKDHKKISTVFDTLRSY
ncbi:Tryptophan biosynthesis protein TrpCF [secondary endosymbiont of Trabutina mannipara]|uniref:Multifunctional fusion protein n=1 Tax=secondary endosymbiont of Trabutina mannipara TaxID=1835721 RepID=A0A1C3L3N9_9ENTR|nr:bifunctional indole-3-glycerol-phosphate synthase TrpC/phosphoribosylanthranilate isomerase TrpF [secondary endosymbiont of Trabutina mannipara]SBT81898.1 Tryptophan biosynthesis protein TrpCF [secondary endosymbiont of Trabutina mannipara]